MISYCAKYVTKCEPRSQSLKDVYATIIRGVKEDEGALNRSAEADDQHNRRARPLCCHLLLMLMMYMASRDFVMLSLDGSRQVEEQLEEGKPATDCQLRITTLAGQPLTL